MTYDEAKDLLLQSFRLLEAEVKLWREMHPNEAALVRAHARAKPHA